MSVPMLVARRETDMAEPPPRTITRKASETVKLPLGGKALDAVASVAHVGFGAVCGAMFAVVDRPSSSIPPQVRGAGFGLLVWAASYAGWIPALGIMPKPDEDQATRQAVMLGSHVVFGGVLGATAGATSR